MFCAIRLLKFSQSRWNRLWEVVWRKAEGKSKAFNPEQTTLPETAFTNSKLCYISYVEHLIICSQSNPHFVQFYLFFVLFCSILNSVKRRLCFITCKTLSCVPQKQNLTSSIFVFTYEILKTVSFICSTVFTKQYYKIKILYCIYPPYKIIRCYFISYYILTKMPSCNNAEYEVKDESYWWVRCNLATVWWTDCLTRHTNQNWNVFKPLRVGVTFSKHKYDDRIPPTCTSLYHSPSLTP